MRTERTGAAAKAGHDLLIHVLSWEATLEVGESTSIALDVDPRSLSVREGTGGMQPLGYEDKANIEQTIDDEVLRGATIEFRSRAIELDPGGTRATVHGELELAGARRPISFELTSEHGRLTGRATVKQSEWGIKPYTALFGTLKVADEVEIGIDARL